MAPTRPVVQQPDVSVPDDQEVEPEEMDAEDLAMQEQAEFEAMFGQDMGPVDDAMSPVPDG